MVGENHIDIKITDDGDLVLGPPLLDSNYEVVLDENGNSMNDIALSEGIDAVDQSINIRLKTEKGDMYLQQMVGQKLGELIGKRNTRENAYMGRDNIIQALTYGGLFKPSQVEVVAVPADKTSVIYHVRTTLEDGTVHKFNLLFDFENGVRRLD